MRRKRIKSIHQNVRNYFEGGEVLCNGGELINQTFNKNYIEIAKRILIQISTLSKEDREDLDAKLPKYCTLGNELLKVHRYLEMISGLESYPDIEDWNDDGLNSLDGIKLKSHSIGETSFVDDSINSNEVHFFKDENGKIIFAMAAYQELGYKYYIPISYWQWTENFPPRPMPVYPQRALPIFNLDKLALDKTSPVIYSSSFSLANLNQKYCSQSNRGLVWSAWPNADTLPALDLHPLTGRLVYVLITPYSDDASCHQSYLLAARFYERLREFEVRDVFFVDNVIHPQAGPFTDIIDGEELLSRVAQLNAETREGK